MADATSPRSSWLAVVDRIVDHNDDTRSIFLQMREDAKLKFIPGQFISILIPLGDEMRRRAYSIASMEAGVIEICFNQVAGGRGVGWLFERAPGDAVEFMGPFGNFTLDAPPQVETIFIAEGTAIAPIRPMLHRAQNPPRMRRCSCSMRHPIARTSCITVNSKRSLRAMRTSASKRCSPATTSTSAFMMR